MNEKKKFWTWKKLTHKQFRMVLGVTMYYSFFTLANMIYLMVTLSAYTNGLYIISYFAIWFFPPIALIVLTYHLLTKVFPPEEKND